MKFTKVPVPPDTSSTEPKILIATWFGAGLVRPAPGTMGTLAGLPLGYVIMLVGGQLGLLIAAFLLLIIGTVSADYYGTKSGTKDDQSIVVDEVVGVWVAALFAGTSIGLWLLAALLFRIFDIWKPWPVSKFDNRSRDGFDVMMDDVVAGVYAMLGVSMAALYLYT